MSRDRNSRKTSSVCKRGSPIFVIAIPVSAFARLAETLAKRAGMRNFGEAGGNDKLFLSVAFLGLHFFLVFSSFG